MVTCTIMAHSGPSGIHPRSIGVSMRDDAITQGAAAPFPSRFAAGTRTSVNNSSEVSRAGRLIFSRLHPRDYVAEACT